MNKKINKKEVNKMITTEQVINYNNKTIEIHHTESGDLHVTAYTHGMNANIRKAHNNDKGYNRVDACDGKKVISVALLTNPIDKK